MPRSEDLQWIEMTDFSPGIHSNNNLAGGLNVTSSNVCIAQPTGTYRCRSLPTGGLGPLPRLQEEFSLTTPPNTPTATTYRVCGLSTWGGVFASPLADTNQDHRAEIHLALDYYDEGSDDRYLDWLREVIYNDTPVTESIVSRTFAAAGSAGTARYAWFLKTRIRESLPLSLGQPVTVAIWANNPIGGSDDNRISRAFPIPSAPTTNTTLEIEDEGSGYTIAVAHQGRIVLGKFLDYSRGVDSGIFSNENLLWTQVNLPDLSTADPAQFVPEIDQNLLDMASMSANALLCIKAIGGGYVLQGDLDDVTVVQLPNLMTADGSDTVKGANTGIGYIYSAGDAGLYVWNGGDSARPISPQLDGKAFTGDITIDGPNGTCDRWQDLFLAPRNWVLDLETEGWWQIADPADIEVRFWSASKYRSQAYGAPKSFVDDETAFALWEMDDLSYTYTWKSHPLWTTRDYRMEVRQGVAALQGHGTVTISVLNENGDSSSETITVDTDVIRNYRFDLSQNAENITVTIEASGDTGSGPGTAEAPLVHRVFIGYRTATHLANSNQA